MDIGITFDYEGSVTAFLRGQPSDAPDVAVASGPYPVHHVPVARYADAAVLGIPVVVFGNWSADVSGSVVVALPDQSFSPDSA